MRTLLKPGFAIILIIFLGSVAAFYGSPTTFSVKQIIDPNKEVDSFIYPVGEDPKFGDRVIDSTWAMVLNHSEYSAGNASGLEALRNWAKHQFTQDRQFLKPVVLPQSHARSTMTGALFSSLFNFQYQFLESTARAYLSYRIAEFHKSSAFQSFRVDFYDLFGVNQESIKLISSYQETRARQSISVLINFAVGLLFTIIILFNYLLDRRRMSPGAARRALAFASITLSGFYLINGCVTNNVEALAGSLLALLTGSYLLFPVQVKRDDNKNLKWFRIELSTRVMVVLFWITISLVFIQLINWIKGGILTDPDPLTLLIGALTGNFIHDPLTIKRTITEVIGISWLSLTVLTVYFYRSEAGRSQEIETELRNLERQKVGIQ